MANLSEFSSWLFPITTSSTNTTDYVDLSHYLSPNQYQQQLGHLQQMLQGQPIPPPPAPAKAVQFDPRIWLRHRIAEITALAPKR